MPSEIRPSSERGRNENDRRSQLGNPEKRPQKTSTVRGFGSGIAGRHHLRFMDTVPSSSQAREQIEYNRHIQKVLAERNGKTLPHCEVQLGYREGLRGGTPEEAEAYRNSLSPYRLKQSRLAEQDLPSDGGDAILAEYSRLYHRPAENQRAAGSSRQEAYRNSLSPYRLKQSRLAEQDLPSDGGDAILAEYSRLYHSPAENQQEAGSSRQEAGLADVPDSRQGQIEELVKDLIAGELPHNIRIRSNMRENMMTHSEYREAKEYINTIDLDRAEKQCILSRIRDGYCQ